ncbi:Rrf2 family transcriptional regulator [Chlorobium phaeovibrioides]|uniref:Rrf2 family transcriptional regulator n=2 Tax=Chlorobium phaeovibrioides TaxID=1094 RepID=A0A432AVY6_CHLPH|nr:Rrf2 family transcriptional regulator [Chlorobium phaeovibrioides]HCD36349.1 Rrf2 family transcriptional regulator [Chlorobium sp.]KAA6232226.1 Rrf2 family transcriptional regulator [Chlorobium phaeovibrioides]MWV54912.1 Rrf2 family transcriptional regulator [Chlorobium phaeovibrioides]QEQ57269.1 Rrf2 family transcriptional regulator [Chlorobium phaeovibrioides]RTY34813.1 Rrf2 family transcriptional regulator [Chlorobium phaeovibrioides]
MLQVSRKFEYGLHAVAYLAMKGSGEAVTVKEMARDIGFSQEFLAKAMQNLTRAGIASSAQGVKGGYMLARLPSEITVADIGLAIEGEPHMVRCIVNADSCEIYSSCRMRGYIIGLQNSIQGLLASTTVATLLQRNEH